MCPAVRKSLRTPDWRHRRQEKGKAIVVGDGDGGGGLGGDEEHDTPVLMQR
jgi:hypothetical protein